MLDTVCKRPDGSRYGTRGKCRKGRETSGLGEGTGEVVRNVASWAVGKAIGGAIAATAEAHGIPSDAAKLLAESGAQALAAVAIAHKQKGLNATQATKMFLTEASGALLGKASLGVDDAILGGDREVADLVASLAGRSTINAVTATLANHGRVLHGLLNRNTRRDASGLSEAERFALLALTIGASHLQQSRDIKLKEINQVLKTDRLDAIALLRRFDEEEGAGKPCGDSHINAQKTCHIGKGQSTKSKKVEPLSKAEAIEAIKGLDYDVIQELGEYTLSKAKRELRRAEEEQQFWRQPEIKDISIDLPAPRNKKEAESDADYWQKATKVRQGDLEGFTERDAEKIRRKTEDYDDDELAEIAKHSAAWAKIYTPGSHKFMEDIDEVPTDEQLQSNIERAQKLTNPALHSFLKSIDDADYWEVVEKGLRSKVGKSSHPFLSQKELDNYIIKEADAAAKAAKELRSGGDRRDSRSCKPPWKGTLGSCTRGTENPNKRAIASIAKGGGQTKARKERVKRIEELRNKQSVQNAQAKAKLRASNARAVENMKRANAGLLPKGPKVKPNPKAAIASSIGRISRQEKLRRIEETRARIEPFINANKAKKAGEGHTPIPGSFAPYDPGTKARRLRAIEGRKNDPTLQDLFSEADRIGSKYQDPSSNVTDLGAARTAKQIVEEAGFNELKNKATSVADLAAKRREKNKKAGEPYQTRSGATVTPGKGRIPTRITRNGQSVSIDSSDRFDAWKWAFDAWQRISTDKSKQSKEKSMGQPCGRGWEGLKGACKRAKKGMSQEERNAISKESRSELVKKIKAAKSAKSTKAAQEKTPTKETSKVEQVKKSRSRKSSPTKGRDGYAVEVEENEFDRNFLHLTPTKEGEFSRNTLTLASLHGRERSELGFHTGVPRGDNVTQTNRSRSLAGYLAPAADPKKPWGQRDLNKHWSVNRNEWGEELLADAPKNGDRILKTLSDAARSKGKDVRQVSMDLSHKEVAEFRKNQGQQPYRIIDDTSVNREGALRYGGRVFKPTERKTKRPDQKTYRIVANVDSNGNLVKPSLEEIKAAKSRQILDRLRDYQFQAGVRNTYTAGADDIGRPDFGAAEAGPRKLRRGLRETEAYKEEERWARAVEKLDNKISGRNAGRGTESFSTKTVAKAREEARTWAKSQGFDLDAESVNGFNRRQALAHDIAHPITHKAIGLDTSGLKRHFKTDSLIPEEAVVNAMEHLSRGDTLEASILSGLRVSRTLAREEESSQDMVRLPEYEKQVREIVQKAYQHPDHYLHLALIRNSNRVADTVFQGGEDFNMPLADWRSPRSVAEQNASYRRMSGTKNPRKTENAAPSASVDLLDFEDLFG